MQLEKLNKKLKMASPKGSIKSKNISPNAAVSLDLVADLVAEEEKKALIMSKLGDAESYVFPDGFPGFTIKFDNVMQFANLLEII